MEQFLKDENLVPLSGVKKELGEKENVHQVEIRHNAVINDAGESLP